jgi:hypothetical protein
MTDETVGAADGEDGGAGAGALTAGAPPPGLEAPTGFGPLAALVPVGGPGTPVAVEVDPASAPVVPALAADPGASGLAAAPAPEVRPAEPSVASSAAAA